MKISDKKRYCKIAAALFVFLFFVAANASLAQTESETTEPKTGIGQWADELEKGVSKTEVYETGAVGEGGAAATIARYIGGILYLAPFLGFLFLARIVIAGYEWMTAGGNSEKIEQAKKRIKNATIGLIIFAIVYFLAYFFVKMFAGLAGYEGGFDTINNK
ncbi:MAG: hypothetical protein PHQ42_00935 [Patescibacteria group bacterium]|nr:hypothetical protein [Patescibacteria group bacterium]